MKATYYAIDGMNRTEIKCDSVELVVDDGKFPQKLELQFRKSDEEIALYAEGTLVIIPRSTNTVRIRLEH